MPLLNWIPILSPFLLENLTLLFHNLLIHPLHPSLLLDLIAIEIQLNPNLIHKIFPRQLNVNDIKNFWPNLSILPTPFFPFSVFFLQFYLIKFSFFCSCKNGFCQIFLLLALGPAIFDISFIISLFSHLLFRIPYFKSIPTPILFRLPLVPWFHWGLFDSLSTVLSFMYFSRWPLPLLFSSDRFCTQLQVSFILLFLLYAS